MISRSVSHFPMCSVIFLRISALAVCLTPEMTHVIRAFPTVYQVDTNCDGTVDWEEYLTFMLLECRERDIMTTVDLKPFPHTIRLVQSEHRDSIIRIVIVPYISSHLAAKSSYSNLNGRYVACGKDGTVTFWSMGMEHKTSEKVKSFAQTIETVHDCCTNR